MRTIYTFAAVAAVALMQTNALSAPMVAYNSSTGNITFELDEPVIGLDLKSESGAFNAASISDSFPAGTTVDTSLAPEIVSFLNFGGLSGSIDAGNIVTPGTAVSDLSFGFLRAFGTPVVPGDIVDVGGPTAMLVGSPNPADGPIDLTDIFTPGGGLAADRIGLSNGSGSFDDLGAISFNFLSNDEGLFGAGAGSSADNVNLTLDVDAARGGAIRNVGAQLQISSEFGGSITYDLTATVPEPATLSLIGLALVGVAGMRRRV